MLALHKSSQSAVKLFSNVDLPRWDAAIAASERARPDLLSAHAGELAVRHSSAGKKAKRSVVLLRAGQLTWFKVKSADSAAGGAPTVVDLALATVKEDGDEAFSLWTPDHKFPVLFTADSNTDRDLWLAAIRQQIADALADQHLDEEAGTAATATSSAATAATANAAATAAAVANVASAAPSASVQSHHSAAESDSGSAPSGAAATAATAGDELANTPPRRTSSKASGVEDGADSQDSESSTSVAGASSAALAAAAPRRHDNETIQRLTELLRHVEGNDRCVDCGSRKPLWVSLNLGVLLCIECCGVHRQLGSHISKVRSLALDRWDVEAIAYLTHVGNTLANQARRVTLSIVQRTLHPTATRDERSSYIKAKYAPPATPPPAAELDKLCELLWANRPKRDMLELQRLLAAGVDANGASGAAGLLGGARPLHVAAALNSTVYVELLLNWGAVIDERAIQIANDRNALLTTALLWRRAGTDAARFRRPSMLRAGEPALLSSLVGGSDALSYHGALLRDACAVATRFEQLTDAAVAPHAAALHAAVRRALRIVGALELVVERTATTTSGDVIVPELRALVKALQAGTTRAPALGDALELASCIQQLADFSWRAVEKATTDK